jgi:MtN3 and saliva related transmembrane protein
MCDREFDGYEAIGYATGILFPAALVPQVYKSYKTKELDDISYSWQCVFMGGLFGSVVYGLKHQLIPIYMSAIVEICLMTSLVVMKFVYSRSTETDTGDAVDPPVEP